MVTVPLSMQHPREASVVSARLDVPVGLSLPPPRYAALEVGWANVIDCDALLAVTVRTTSVAAPNSASHACELLSVDSLVRLVMVAMPLAMEHPPEASVLTARLEDVLGVTPKLVANVVGD